MQIYSVWRLPVWSFFSRRLYADLAGNWRGTGLAYLASLLVVCVVPVLVLFQSNLNLFTRGDGLAMVRQLPPILIVNGRATVSGRQPVEVREPSTGRLIALLDTTRPLAEIPMQAPFLIGQDGISLRWTPERWRDFSFRNIGRLQVDEALLTAWMDRLARWATLTLYPVAVLVTFAFRALLALAYAAAGFLLVKRLAAPLPFLACLRIAVVAMTPAIVLGTVLNALRVSLPWEGLWYFVLSIGYFVFGLRSASSGPLPAVASSTAPGPSRRRSGVPPPRKS